MVMPKRPLVILTVVILSHECAGVLYRGDFNASNCNKNEAYTIETMDAPMNEHCQREEICTEHCHDHSDQRDCAEEDETEICNISNSTSCVHNKNFDPFCEGVSCQVHYEDHCKFGDVCEDDPDECHDVVEEECKEFDLNNCYGDNAQDIGQKRCHVQESLECDCHKDQVKCSQVQRRVCFLGNPIMPGPVEAPIKKREIKNEEVNDEKSKFKRQIASALCQGDQCSLDEFDWKNIIYDDVKENLERSRKLFEAIKEMEIQKDTNSSKEEKEDVRSETLSDVKDLSHHDHHEVVEYDEPRSGRDIELPSSDQKDPIGFEEIVLPVTSEDDAQEDDDYYYYYEYDEEKQTVGLPSTTNASNISQEEGGTSNQNEFVRKGKAERERGSSTDHRQQPESFTVSSAGNNPNRVSSQPGAEVASVDVDHHQDPESGKFHHRHSVVVQAQEPNADNFPPIHSVPHPPKVDTEDVVPNHRQNLPQANVNHSLNENPNDFSQKQIFKETSACLRDCRNITEEFCYDKEDIHCEKHSFPINKTALAQNCETDFTEYCQMEPCQEFIEECKWIDHDVCSVENKTIVKKQCHSGPQCRLVKETLCDGFVPVLGYHIEPRSVPVKPQSELNCQDVFRKVCQHSSHAQRCKDVVIAVPTKVCKTEKINKCVQIPNPSCHHGKHKKCRKVAKEVCRPETELVKETEVVKKCSIVPKRVCQYYRREMCANHCHNGSPGPTSSAPRCSVITETSCPAPSAETCPRDTCHTIRVDLCLTRLPKCKVLECKKRVVKECKKRCQHEKTCVKEPVRKCVTCEPEQLCTPLIQERCLRKTFKSDCFCEKKCKTMYLCPMCKTHHQPKASSHHHHDIRKDVKIALDKIRKEKAHFPQYQRNT